MMNRARMGVRLTPSSGVEEPERLTVAVSSRDLIKLRDQRWNPALVRVEERPFVVIRLRLPRAWGFRCRDHSAADIQGYLYGDIDGALCIGTDWHRNDRVHARSGQRDCRRLFSERERGCGLERRCDLGFGDEELCDLGRRVVVRFRPT